MRREVPVTESRKSRRGMYYIADPYFAFWSRYVHPNEDLIETGQGELLVDIVMDDLNEYLGGVFEDVARQFLVELNRAQKLPSHFTKIGCWWRKGEEIDLVALNEREKKALFVEVKWKSLSEREARGILRDLERKAELVDLDDWEKHYGLVAMSAEGKERLREGGFLLWGLRAFEQLKTNPMGVEFSG